MATPEATTSDDPLIDLFIEIFELREKSNWLRRQAVQLVLQQILGGAIERRVADTVRWAVASEEMWCWYVGRVRETLEFYAGEEKVRAWRPRTEEERHATKVDAFKKLMVLVPDVLGSMVKVVYACAPGS